MQILTEKTGRKRNREYEFTENLNLFNKEFYLRFVREDPRNLRHPCSIACIIFPGFTFGDPKGDR